VRSPKHPQAPHPALGREKLPLPGEVERLFGARPASERPGSLREAIVRWLNEEV
jgi:hypothetical protein